MTDLTESKWLKNKLSFAFHGTELRQDQPWSTHKPLKHIELHAHFQQSLRLMIPANTKLI